MRVHTSLVTNKYTLYCAATLTKYLFVLYFAKFNKTGKVSIKYH